MPTRATPSYSTVIYSAIVKTWHEKPQLTGMLSCLLKPSWIWCSTKFLKKCFKFSFPLHCLIFKHKLSAHLLSASALLQGHVTTLSTPPAGVTSRFLLSQCDKIRRKRSTFLGSFRVAHTNAIDDTDSSISRARWVLTSLFVRKKTREYDSLGFYSISSWSLQ